MTAHSFVMTDDMVAEGMFLDGTLKLANGDVQGAKRAFEEALRLSPDYSSPKQALAQLGKK